MHHYTASGLDYVWLRDGFEYRDTPRGQVVRIHNLDGLHAEIARWIVSSRWRLRGQEVRFLRSMLQLSQEGLARALRQSRPSVARWEAARGKGIPGAADAALRMFYTLKAEGNDTAKQLVEVLTELDELENGTREARFADDPDGHWKAAA